MGTRGEIYVRNTHVTVELWRHYDSNDSSMVPYFEGFARYASWCVGKQRHWLTYPEDVATMLITYDYEHTLTQQLCFASNGTFEGRADLRPRGDINDFQMVWILDIPNEDSASTVWRVKGFKRGNVNDNDTETMRKAIRECQDHKLEEFLKEVANFCVEPLNHSGCRLCGYPGPLMAIKDPPVCLYCFFKSLRNDDFVRSEVEHALKIAPLMH